MKKIIFVVLTVMLLIPTAVFAQDNFSSWEDLIPYIQGLEERIETLELGLVPGVVKATWDGSNIVSDTPDSKVGNYDIKINKFMLNKTSEGKDVVTIFFQFTNNSAETTSFWSINPTAYQNGVEIEDVIESPLYSNWDVKIRPGVSIEVSSSFLLFDTTNPVELELEESFSWGDEPPVLYVLDLAEATK